MRTKRRRKKSRRLIRLFGWVLFVVLFLSLLGAYIAKQIEIGAKRAELESLSDEIIRQEAENEEIKRVVDGSSDEKAEWIARDTYGYAAPDEHIYVDISGN